MLLTIVCSVGYIFKTFRQLQNLLCQIVPIIYIINYYDGKKLYSAQNYFNIHVRATHFENTPTIFRQIVFQDWFSLGAHNYLNETVPWCSNHCATVPHPTIPTWVVLYNDVVGRQWRSGWAGAGAMGVAVGLGLWMRWWGWGASWKTGVQGALSTLSCM